MGNVYAALSRQGNESSAVGEAVITAQPQVAEPAFLIRPAAQALEPFDCRLYAMPSEKTELALRRRSVTLPTSRRRLIQPEQEVRLNPALMDARLVALCQSDRPVDEQFARLAARLISIAIERPVRRVLIASAQHGEGRTCVTLGLAGALARAGQRALVIDCDCLRPSTLRLLGISAEAGLTETVRGARSPGASVVRVQPAGFDLLPLRERLENPAELFAASGFAELLQTCDEHYDWLLLDSAPLLATADPQLLARQADATLLVIASGQTATKQLARAIAGFKPHDIVGVVLNQVR
jgi:capsular exopolysaccharide synthesis family protein